MKKKTKKDLPLSEAQIAKLGEILAKGLLKGITQNQFKAFDAKDAIETISTLISEKENYYGYLDELREKHRKDFEYSKRYLKEHAKKGDKAIRGIIKMLNTYDSHWLISLYQFLQKVPSHSDCNHIFQRVVAEANRYWGSPSYIVSNVLNGTKQELVSKRTKAYKTIAFAVKEAKSVLGARNRHLSLDGVVSVRDGNHYIAFVSGGNNGHSDWKAYLQSLTIILEECKDAWIIKVDNDCCDDVHYALIGFRINNRIKTRKEK